MARSLKEYRLNDRAARAKLARRKKPYWRLVSEGRHIGYRVGTTACSWVARFRTAGSEVDYIEQKLGGADDRAVADGDAILDWKQALAKANTWFSEQENALIDVSEMPTVGQVVKAYIELRNARSSARRGREVKSTASSRLNIHVLQDAVIAGIVLDKLTEADLRNWMGRVAMAKASTRKRLCADFKAALNRACAEHRKHLSGDIASAIRNGLRVESSEEDTDVSIARENQFLSDASVRLLVEAAYEVDDTGDFGRLVIVLAATGARFSQIRRLQVRDLQPEQSRLFVPPSRKGKGQRRDHYRVQIGRDVVEALAPVFEGRPPDAPLLERWHYVHEGLRWKKDHRGAWGVAHEMTKVWKKVASAAELPDVIPYALRHSSIVRGIRVGLPIRLVAALHDTSVEMIERHYSRWITEGLDELAARAIVPLVAARGPSANDQRAA
jgi:integrase